MGNSKIKSLKSKILHSVLDFLMFIVPLMEITEMIAIIPVEYLPWYMLTTVLLRRLVRILEDHFNAKLD